MTQLETELDGLDFAQGIETSAVPEGTMLLGHVRDEAVLLIRRGDEVFAIGATARIMARHFATVFLSKTRSAAPGIMRAST